LISAPPTLIAKPRVPAMDLISGSSFHTTSAIRIGHASCVTASMSSLAFIRRPTYRREDPSPSPRGFPVARQAF
jgi:hypothetical protein